MKPFVHTIRPVESTRQYTSAVTEGKPVPFSSYPKYFMLRSASQLPARLNPCDVKALIRSPSEDPGGNLPTRRSFNSGDSAKG